MVLMKQKIQGYLSQKHGERGALIYTAQQRIFAECVRNIQGKSLSQKKTMVNVILPRVALYKAFMENGMSQEEAKQKTGDYMEFQVIPVAKKFQALDKCLPFFFTLFKKIFASTVKKDNWIVENLAQSNHQFSLDIVDCLWYNTCVENGCPELCEIFCHADITLYGHLKNTEFLRQGTIASGCDRCDFCFKKRT